ncbi:glycoside hydrolase family 2 protein [Patellaria atrata CBS 101060]|uniref:Glycoside hydrolase family 2 protein n=1 Tax=Patellaria atrata CBS 101060 TaxID=1346257 RepID=A0A9P4VNC2_9PEZI|nr:glycoside hydrolase family 2 protein [Patellaria atrata CBS 101060]
MHAVTGLLTSLLASSALARSLGGIYNRRQSNGTEYAVKEPPLTTPWTYEVGTDPWPEYPRPQLQRSEWKNLNGVWRYRNASSLGDVESPPFGAIFPQEVLVPSCLESGLSGLQGQNVTYSWLSTTFSVPHDWSGERVLLNFAAVDYEATVFVNGQRAGFHRGGYFAFTVDVTQYLSSNSTNELLVFVHDPTDSGDYVIPVGKQTLSPSHIFYRPCTGIWQTVWIESAPADYIAHLDLNANADGDVTVTVFSSSEDPNPVTVEIREKHSTDVLASEEGIAGSPIEFHVPHVDLWSPDSPTLYDVVVKLDEDKIHSYTGFRTYSKGEVDGIQRPLTNGEFIFQFGTLDQGYWPDGLYTPPSLEAMVFDLKVLKKLGFNMVRKHIKVETALFYKACDELGLFVIQDMPSLKPTTPNAEQQVEFERQLELLINQQKHFPSISTWVIYNEGWGQITDIYPEFRLTDRVRKLDPYRLIDATSGWHDHGAGDIHDNHHYANPQCGSPFYSILSTPYDPKRIGFQGEFGGIGHNVSIEHLWNVQEAISTINQTYEVNESLDAWNYRAHKLLVELTEQTDMFACSGGVWTQTTDVEGEVNGLLTYDRRVLRPDVEQWKRDIDGLYDAAGRRGGKGRGRSRKRGGGVVEL